MITRRQAKLIRKLKSRKRKDKEGGFLVEGVRLIEELLASGSDVELFVTAPALAATSRGQTVLETLADGSWPVAEVGDRELENLADTESPQGVLAVARRPVHSLEEFQPEETSAVLVFDRVADPGNLGTLLRTAHALGVAWAIALPGSVDPWNAKAVRASAGSLFRLPVSCEEWQSVVTWLRQHAFAILCADSSGQPVTRGSSVAARFALVLGNEPSGLSGEVLNECDQRVGVPLAGGMDSLNVGIAGALLLDRLLSRPEG